MRARVRMRRSPRTRHAPPAALPRTRHKLESKRRRVLARAPVLPTALVATVSAVLDGQRLEGSAQLRAGRRGRARDGVVVHVDRVERRGAQAGGVVHGELGAAQAEVSVLPFVAEELGAAFAHPACVGAVGAVAEGLGLWGVVGRVVEEEKKKEEEEEIGEVRGKPEPSCK